MLFSMQLVTSKNFIWRWLWRNALTKHAIEPSATIEEEPNIAEEILVAVIDSDDDGTGQNEKGKDTLKGVVRKIINDDKEKFPKRTLHQSRSTWNSNGNDFRTKVRYIYRCTRRSIKRPCNCMSTFRTVGMPECELSGSRKFTCRLLT